nr:hypothetical protein HK105_007704 [Polyrhizophydium stewartii]
MPFPPGVFGSLQAMAAGIMLLLSLKLAFFEAGPTLGLLTGVAWTAVGFVAMVALEQLVPESSPAMLLAAVSGGAERDDDDIELAGDDGKNLPRSAAQSLRMRTLRTGLISFCAMAVHNLPEGISVALTTSSDLRLGVSMCVAIMLHNVLEGVVVALPIWQLTASVSHVLALTLINGLVEPLGVLVVWGVCWVAGIPIVSGPGGGVEQAIAPVLCLVAGVMSGMSVLELIPEALRFVGLGRSSGGTNTNWAARITVAAWIGVGMVGGLLIIAASEVFVGVVSEP